MIEELPPAETRERISALRHDLLHIRRTLAPTRDAVRRVVDDVVEVEKGDEVFQNEVMKTLTVIASLLLLPTFIVGLYGQNFQHNFPEIHWRLGYVWSWAVIVVTTGLQLWFFR